MGGHAKTEGSPLRNWKSLISEEPKVPPQEVENIGFGGRIHSLGFTKTTLTQHHLGKHKSIKTAFVEFKVKEIQLKTNALHEQNDEAININDRMNNDYCHNDYTLSYLGNVGTKVLGFVPPLGIVWALGYPT